MRIAVTNRSLPTLPEVRDELLAKYPDAEIKFNDDQIVFDTEDALVAFLEGYDVAVIGLERFPDSVVARLPDLKVVTCCSVGADHIDPAVLKRHGIRLGWTPGVNKVSVAEITIGLMIDLLHGTNRYNVGLRNGEWPLHRTGRYLRGRIVGIHGCGNIGQQLVEMLQPFGVTILASDRIDYGDFYRRYGVRAVDPETLWRESEILTLHLPRNASTIGLYDAATIDKLRPGILMINTSRGGIVDEEAVLARLEDGRIAAAAFDVFAVEPCFHEALFGLPNFIATPHIAGSAVEAREAMARSGIKGIEDNAVPEPGVYPFD